MPATYKSVHRQFHRFELAVTMAYDDLPLATY